MNLKRIIIAPDRIEPKLSGLGSGRIAIAAVIALLAIVTGCVQSANDRREAFLDARAEVVVAMEPEPIVQAAGWPWVDTGVRLARRAAAEAVFSDASFDAGAAERP